ncbi:MAG: hypothetical protein PWQ91_1700 [Eubacteriales bacterium]|nr:hypothetical protein [Eubacteriales bacterium]
MSNLVRQRFIVLVISLASTLALLAGCSDSGPPQVPQQRDQAAREQHTAQTVFPTAATQAGSRTIQAVVTSVSDGDTVHVNLNG